VASSKCHQRMQPIDELSACSMPGWKNFLQVDAGSCRGGVEPRLVIHKRVAFIDQLPHSFLKSPDLVVELFLRAGIHDRISRIKGVALSGIQTGQASLNIGYKSPEMCLAILKS
jgi:hypothetical protein